jgi:hypothetical protein
LHTVDESDEVSAIWPPSASTTAEFVSVPIGLSPATITPASLTPKTAIPGSRSVNTPAFHVNSSATNAARTLDA